MHPSALYSFVYMLQRHTMVLTLTVRFVHTPKPVLQLGTELLVACVAIASERSMGQQQLLL